MKRVAAYARLSTMKDAQENRAVQLVLSRKCSENPRLHTENAYRTAENKITVVDIVSTTVMNLVAAGGLEPPTSGL